MSRTFTLAELAEYSGRDGKPVYVAVRGQVFDMSSGASFYGPGKCHAMLPVCIPAGPMPSAAGQEVWHCACAYACGPTPAGGPYEVFAGKEVARALGLMKIDAAECNDDLSGLDDKQLQTLQDWVSSRPLTRFISSVSSVCRTMA